MYLGIYATSGPNLSLFSVTIQAIFRSRNGARWHEKGTQATVTTSLALERSSCFFVRAPPLLALHLACSVGAGCHDNHDDAIIHSPRCFHWSQC